MATIQRPRVVLVVELKDIVTKSIEILMITTAVELLFGLSQVLPSNLQRLYKYVGVLPLFVRIQSNQLNLLHFVF